MADQFSCFNIELPLALNRAWMIRGGVGSEEMLLHVYKYKLVQGKCCYMCTSISWFRGNAATCVQV